MNKYIDIAKEYWLKEEDVLNQIRREKEIGEDYVRKKRSNREKDLESLYVPSEKKDKININSVYTTMQTLMSVYYTDKMTVQFDARKPTWIEKASNLNKIAEFDYDKMNLEQIDYQWAWDSFFFWVGLKVVDWWNKTTATPVAKIISPLSWIPDPRGWFTIEDHRWAWFDVENSLAWLKASGKYKNLDLINSAAADRQEEIRRAYSIGRSLDDQGVEQIDNKKYSIYHHYTIIEGEKWLVTTANYNTIIIKMFKLPAITEEEKENPLAIPFPISLKYYSPVKGDPYWISVPDLLRDKQKAESKLFNLAIAKETRNTLWEDIFYNPQKIGNSKTLTTPSINPKAIPVKIRADESISNVVYRMPKETQANNAFNVGSQLQLQNSLSTWIDANSLWVGGIGNQTATEAQITQKNANLRFILWTKVAKWWEAFFYHLYIRSYIHNLSPRQKKITYITKSFWTQYFEFKKKDFLWKEDFDIKIISSAEKENLKNQQKADFYAIAPQMLSNPSTPEVSKRYIRRKMLRLTGLSEDEILVMEPKSPDELKAENDVIALNKGKKIPKPISWQDHLTYIFAYHSANDSIEKWQAIDERIEKYIEEGWDRGVAENVWKEGWGDNTLGNIAASNASQQNSARLQGDLLWQNVSGNTNWLWI